MEEKENQVKNAEINLSEIFKKNNPIIPGDAEYQKEPEPKADKPKEKKSPPKEENNKPEEPIEDDEDDETDSPKEEKSPDAKNRKEEPINSHPEYLKLEKKLKETQKWGNENNKKLVAYSKAIEKLKEESGLTDEEASFLLDYTKHDPIEEQEKPLLVQFGEVWDKELNYMRKYSQNAQDIDNYVVSFQNYFQTLNHKEAQELLEELHEIKESEDEVAFTKKMLDIGKDWYDDFYKDIQEAGSLKNLRGKYQEKEAKLQKTLDKLNKELEKYKRKYEDYTESNLNLPSGNSANSPTDLNSGSFDLAKTFQKRFEPKRY